MIMKVAIDFQGLSLGHCRRLCRVVHSVVVVPIVVLGTLLLWRANLSLGHLSAEASVPSIVCTDHSDCSAVNTTS